MTPPDDVAAAAAAPWHEGERAVQARLGVRERMDKVGPRNIRRFMPDQHRLFFAQLPFLVAGSVDRGGATWASLLAGPPGFASSPDPKTLHIAARPVAGDPLAEAMRPGAPLGLLGIELPTRRRNRMNGRITAVDGSGLSVAVEQSFGNCNQYIQRREYVWTAPSARVPHVDALRTIDDEARTLIQSADTCFVASASSAEPSPTEGVDVSHRGGRPGFIGIDGDGALVIPDYAGNRFFNTLGNLLVNPRAGLLFLDFARGDLLQLTGRTDIVWDGPAVQAFRGAERLWRFHPVHGRWLRGALPVRFEFGDLSPNHAATGTWREAQQALLASTQDRTAEGTEKR
jgi:predicted pyridoxine 5'-phosphate oxidase superfamily flavin-nucleotide-binding protein